tara:strand:- start:220 stop:561 length:342 start_codon:yes stop_codon:yes gene_type:complete
VTIESVLDELALIDSSILEDVCAFAAALRILPVSDVPITVGKLHVTASLEVIVHEVTFEQVTILVQNGAMTLQRKRLNAFMKRQCRHEPPLCGQMKSGRVDEGRSQISKFWRI